MNFLTKWRTIAFAVAIFAAGAVSGGAIGYYQARAHMFHSPGREEIASHIAARLQSRLGLTPDQSTRINPIISRAAADLHVIRMDTATRINRVFDNAYAQIIPFLTPDQHVKLDRMYQDHLRHRRMMLQHWHAHHPGADSGSAPVSSPPPGGAVIPGTEAQSPAPSP